MELSPLMSWLVVIVVSFVLYRLGMGLARAAGRPLPEAPVTADEVEAGFVAEGMDPAEARLVAADLDRGWNR